MLSLIKKFKKQATIAVLVLAVLAVGMANYSMTSKSESSENELSASTPADAETVDAFSAYRTEREETRQQELSYIDSVAASAEADDQTKAQAQEQKLTLTANMEKELTSEGLISTKLGLNAVVTVKEGAVNVVVDKEELTSEEVAQIAEILKTDKNNAVMTAQLSDYLSALVAAAIASEVLMLLLPSGALAKYCRIGVGGLAALIVVQALRSLLPF